MSRDHHCRIRGWRPRGSGPSQPDCANMKICIDQRTPGGHRYYRWADSADCRLACVTTRHRCTRSRLESARRVFSLQRTEGRRSLRHSETPGHGPPSALFKYVDYLSGSGDRIVGRRAAAALQAAAAGVCCDCRPRFDPACAQPRHLGTQPRYLAPSVT